MEKFSYNREISNSITKKKNSLTRYIYLICDEKEKRKKKSTVCYREK